MKICPFLVPEGNNHCHRHYLETGKRSLNALHLRLCEEGLFPGYHSWLDEEDAGCQREEQRVYPQDDLAPAQAGTQAHS